MRVALLTRSLEQGGAERQLCLLARGLKARGHEVSVVGFYPQGPLEAELKAAGVPVWCPDKTGRWDWLGFGLRLGGLLRELRPEALYAFLDTPCLAAAWLKPWLKGAKVVWGVRTSDMDLARYDWFARFTHGLLAASARGADLIIANSRAGAAHHQKQGLPAARMTVIPNGIDTDRFRPDPASGRPWREAWGVAEGQPLVGVVARLDPIKDISGFLRAAALMAQARPELRFVVVGGGPEAYARGLRAQAEDLGLAGALVWAGEQTDIPGIMNALDLCVLSSDAGEGFPNVVGEAMACARPCLVTRVGDAAWVVGEASLTAPPGDPRALAAAGLAHLALPLPEREALGQALRRRVEENFSLEAMVRATEEVLTGLIRVGHSSRRPLRR